MCIKIEIRLVKEKLPTTINKCEILIIKTAHATAIITEKRKPKSERESENPVKERKELYTVI